VAIRSRLGNPHFAPRRRGVYVVDGSITMTGETCGAGQMMVFRPSDSVSLHAGEEVARLMMLGGATLERRSYIWWNFVASSQERIKGAKVSRSARTGRMDGFTCRRTMTPSPFLCRKDDDGPGTESRCETGLRAWRNFASEKRMKALDGAGR
jgi:hypothetical protein